MTYPQKDPGSRISMYSTQSMHSNRGLSTKNLWHRLSPKDFCNRMYSCVQNYHTYRAGGDTISLISSRTQRCTADLPNQSTNVFIITILVHETWWGYIPISSGYKSNNHHKCGQFFLMQAPDHIRNFATKYTVLARLDRNMKSLSTWPHLGAISIFGQTGQCWPEYKQ